MVILNFLKRRGDQEGIRKKIKREGGVFIIDDLIKDILI